MNVHVVQLNEVDVMFQFERDFLYYRDVHVLLFRLFRSQIGNERSFFKAFMTALMIYVLVGV